MERSEAAGLHDVGALEALRVPTRRRLYEHVVQCGRPVSRDECSQAVRVDRSLVAYHLDKLVEHGLLEVTYSRPHGRTGPGAGRPAKLYRRAAREFVLRAPARDYRLLAEVLVRAADEKGRAVRAGIERAALELGRDLAAGIDPERGDEALTVLLRSRGYEPFSEEPGLLRLRNCPFGDVAAHHRELVCGLNLALVRGVLAGLGTGPGRAVLAPEDDGGCCVAIAAGAR